MPAPSMKRIAVVEKLDLYRLHRDEYVTPGKPTLVDVGPARYLVISGQGAPADKAFQDAIGALYNVAFTIKMTQKSTGKDYKVCPLEGLWWCANGEASFNSQDPKSWNWKLMIRVPEFITQKDRDEAVDQLYKKGKPAQVSEVSLETVAEGRCVQVLYVGRYDQETEMIAGMMEFARQQGLAFHGVHHEIYLSDPRRVPAARLRTILRHAVR